MRVAHIITHPIQYFAPLYRCITALGNLDLTVFFGSTFGVEPSYDEGFQQQIQFDVPLLDGYQHKFLRNSGSGVPNGAFWNFNCPTLDQELRAGKFDAVWIHGWGYRFQWQAAKAARSLGIPYFVRAETHGLTGSSSFYRGLARRLFVRKLLRGAAGCLYLGKRNRDFYRRMGIPPERLFPAHYSINVAAFNRQDAQEQASSMRQAFDVRENDFLVITASKAIERKRLDDTIRAISLCQDTRLWIVGDGPHRRRLEELSKALLPGRATWHGFVNQGQLPALLFASDAFVLASDNEPWGLAVNEAMACGLPCVVAQEVGCAPDLIREGETGYHFPAHDIATFAERLRILISNRKLARVMGINAQRLVAEQYDVMSTAKQICDAMDAVVRSTSNRPSLAS